MKRIIFSLCLAGTLAPAQAQLVTSDSLGGAALGGILGGVIGHNTGRRSAEGAAIGAGAGFLLGALTHQTRRDYYYTTSPGVVYYSSPAYVSAPYYYSPYYYHSAPYSYHYHRPHHAVTGAALGGIAGGVIGHNRGRRTAEGIAIGAGAGLLLGGLAEHEARRYPPVYSGPAVVRTYTPVHTVTAPAAPAASSTAGQGQPARTLAASPRTSPMSAANSLFGR